MRAGGTGSLRIGMGLGWNEGVAHEGTEARRGEVGGGVQAGGLGKGCGLVWGSVRKC